MTGPAVSVGRRFVVEMVRRAALEVPGVAGVQRGGPWWRRALGGDAVTARVGDGRVAVRLTLVARSGQPLGPLADAVRTAVAATVERSLGLELERLSVVVDGVEA